MWVVHLLIMGIQAERYVGHRLGKGAPRITGGDLSNGVGPRGAGGKNLC